MSTGLTVRELGSGPLTLVWFPALADSAASFAAAQRHLVDALPGRLRVIAVDPPGYGGDSADLLPLPLQWGRCARWAEGLRGPLLVAGSSVGAASAVAIAAALPGRTLGLVQVGWPDPRCGAPTPDGLFPRDDTALQALHAASWHQPPPLGRRVRQALRARLDDPALHAHATSLDLAVLARLLDAWRGPTLWVGGRSDGLVPAAALDASARRHALARAVHLDECGHYPHRERPRALAAVLARFVDCCTRHQEVCDVPAHSV